MDIKKFSGFIFYSAFEVFHDIQGVLGETLQNCRILLLGSKQEQKKNGRVCPEMCLFRRYSGMSGFFSRVFEMVYDL